MDAATIAGKVAAGYGRAATVLGRSVSLYRPNGTGSVVTAANLIQTQLAAFDCARNFSPTSGDAFATRLFYAMADSSAWQIFDHVATEDGETYFVGRLDDIRAPMVVRCDRTLIVKRPSAGTPGENFYSNNRTASESILLSGWPAALMPETRSEPTNARLPGDARAPMALLLMAQAPVQIRFGDILYDDLPTPSRYLVSSAIYSPLGVEITAAQALI